jgi:hypothetical protein
MAFGNLRSEVITLWNEALKKDKILHSVDLRRMLRKSEVVLRYKISFEEVQLHQL